MTEQTPLERLDEASSNWDACHPNDFEFFSQRLFDAAQAYRDYAEARIKELEELMQWKPLDSAPKDGRIILLRGNDSHETVVISDWWHSYANGDGHWEYADAMDDFNPTHWMEMP